MKIKPLALAEKIINDNRLDDPDDWGAMRAELIYELDQLNIKDLDTRKKVILAVKSYLY